MFGLFPQRKIPSNICHSFQFVKVGLFELAGFELLWILLFVKKELSEWWLQLNSLKFFYISCIVDRIVKVFFMLSHSEDSFGRECVTGKDFCCGGLAVHTLDWEGFVSDRFYKHFSKTFWLLLGFGSWIWSRYHYFLHFLWR
jgi:hypothetical protein